jgi:hypothetical protein
MANRADTLADVNRRKTLETKARLYRPPVRTVERYFWSRKAVTPTQEKIMSESIDVYMERLKKACLKPELVFAPRELRHNEVPKGLESAWTEFASPSGPRKIVRAFDETDFYRSQDPPLTSHLPDIFVARAFRNYVEKNNERMSEVLRQPFVPPGPDFSQPASETSSEVSVPILDFA